MEYTLRKRLKVKQEDSALLELYPHDLQFYKTAPRGHLDLKEFQDWSFERRQILQLVESIVQRTDLKGPEEKKLSLLKSLRKDGFTYAAKLLNGLGCASHTDLELQARKRDHISHFILRYSYSRNQELRRWFVNMEGEYLKLRFHSMNKEGILKLLSLNNFDYAPISQEEKNDVRENLHISTAKISSVENVEFYKVPFQKVFDLVRGRRVYIHKGMAYIPQSELASFFIADFKSSLSIELEKMADNFRSIEDDPRLSSYLKNLPNVFSGMTKAVWSTAAVPIESLDELSRISYPPCMRSLHDSVKADSHLKNGGRMQYGLFLKGIGVTLEDALRFWRTEFCKKIDLEKFEKQYAYDIRHYFGKEGRRTNYTPMGCNKIITSSLGPGDIHGCPFKHMSNDNLKKTLTSYGLPASGVGEAADLAKEGNYLLACTKCFEVTHKTLPDRPFVHPNAYFAQSREIITKSMGGGQNSQSNADKLSQSSRMKTERMSTTPSRNVGTPSRNFGSPSTSRNAGIPSTSRNFGSPSTPRNAGAPSTSGNAGIPTATRNFDAPAAKRGSSQMDPVNIEELLNADEMDEMMEDM